MRTVLKHSLILPGLAAACLLSACTTDVRDNTLEEKQSIPEISSAPSFGTGTSAFTMRLSTSSIEITEGQGLVEIPVEIERNSVFEGDVSLSVESIEGEDNIYLGRRFSDELLDNSESASSVQLTLTIGPKPIKPKTHRLRISASSNAGQTSSAQLTVQLLPTGAPDVYLLIGQSNMVGISELEAIQSGPGEPDQPVDSIRQLNVTFNDVDNFSKAADFTNPEKLYNTGNPLTTALDPLHSGLQGDGQKFGSRVGMGMSFAKRASADSSRDIYLVPSAWSDSGFCKRDSNSLAGLGWNATQKENPALSGTLLHDRAIARTNAALSMTNGILRGILWHQGEADSDTEACAQSYMANLTEMVTSLRSNIALDARGPSARGASADIPFIVGTMSTSGEQSPFSPIKLMVDNAHRNIASNIPFADFVNNDDLVSPAYQCGGGSCIHFGADALREMGVRYYDRLQSVLP